MSAKFLALSAAACIAVCGCHRGNHTHGKADQGHDHEHAEAEATQFTVWTDAYEVFGEYEPFVAGKAGQLVAHVTDLRTSEPRRAGSASFRLAQGERSIEHSETKPARDGIYLPQLAFPTVGKWRVTVQIPQDGASAAIVLPEINVFANEHDALHAEVPEAPSGIAFLKEQQWIAGSKAEPVAKKQLVERLRVPAMIIAKPGTLAHVTPPMPGKVHPPENAAFALLGTRVTAGQTLALLHPAFSEATAQLGEVEEEIARARLAAAQAERDYTRAKKLADEKIVATQEVENAQLALDSARATLEAMLALRTSYKHDPGAAQTLPTIELKAPIEGIIVSQAGAAIGEHVAADKPLFTVLDASTVFIEGRVPDAHASRVKHGADALLEAGSESHWRILGDANGRFVFLGPQLDSATRTVPLVYEVANSSGRLRIGQMVTLHVETARSELTLAIPDSAIVEEAGQPVVFVQVAGETFERRMIRPGIRDGKWVQVLSGLNEGDRVVTHGAYAVRLASVSTAIPAHGHVH